jgi:hypothetical protein
MYQMYFFIIFATVFTIADGCFATRGHGGGDIPVPTTMLPPPVTQTTTVASSTPPTTTSSTTTTTTSSPTTTTTTTCPFIDGNAAIFIAKGVTLFEGLYGQKSPIGTCGSTSFGAVYFYDGLTPYDA